MTAFEQFHLLRPAWLLALLPLLLLLVAVWRRSGTGSAWERICDPHLLQHLLVMHNGGRQRWPWLGLSAGWLLAVLALAGPTWSKLPQPVLRAQDAVVVLLDMSRSMDAQDVKPSRLARAKFKLLDLLERHAEGQVALLVFAAEPYVVSPLTDDAKTIAAMIPALETNLMPAQGSRPDRAIAMAQEMLQNTGVARGHVILLTDGLDKPEPASRAAQNLQAAGHRLSVLAVGSGDGAPIPLSKGGYVKNADGAIVISQMQREPLRALAETGGGRMASVTVDDADLRQLLAAGYDLSGDRYTPVEQQADVWREQGPWLVLALLPIALLAFRRGLLAGVAVAALSLPAAPPAQAGIWQDLWQNRDQQGSSALAAGQPEKAAELFNDPQWRGTALYRAGQYDQASDAFAQARDADALYNRGNALVGSGRLGEALEAYQQALALAPDHRDAQFNKQLLEQWLEQSDSNADPSSGEHSAANESGDQQDQQGGSGSESERDSGAAGQSQGRNAASDDSGQNAAQSRPQQADDESGTSANPNQQQQQANQPQADHAGQPSDRQDEGQDGDTAQTRDAAGKDGRRTDRPEEPSGGRGANVANAESQQALEQWLRRIPDDPGGLLRRKFMREYQLRGDRNAESNPW